MSRCRICIAKIGGSLLSTVDLQPRLRKWLRREMATQQDTHYLLIAGGGKLVDAVRDIDRASQIDSAVAHWICVELMDITARLLGAMLPDVTVVERFQQVEERVDHPGVTIFCPSDFLRQIEPQQPGTRLAADWSVTSDAIAGRLAVVLAADEVVLVKSVAPPATKLETLSQRLVELAALGYVDQFLIKLARELVSLRFAVLPACGTSCVTVN
jgi:5-(aminomethyl)-3-furanmethanol phosphate kinase